MNWRKNGLLLMLLSNLLFGFLPVTVKWSNERGYAALQATFFRFSIAMVGVAVLAITGQQRLKVANARALFWRGFFGGLSVLLFFMTLQLTTAGKATLFNYTYTIWANVFAVVLGREKPPKGFGKLLVLALLGLWLVLGVRLDRMVLGDALGVLSGMASGAAVLAVKEARHTDNALSTFGSFTLFGWAFSLIALLVGARGEYREFSTWTPVDAPGFALLMAMGLVAMAAQLLFTQGYGYTSLAMGTLLSLLVPVLASLFGWILLGEPLTPGFLSGTLLVLMACYLLTRREARAA